MSKLGIIFLGLAVLAAGCAKTVTTLGSFGTQLTVEVNLKGPIDTVNNRYFIIFRSSSGIKTPLPPPLSQDEFLSVGDLPQSGSAESYYANYYSTWDGYIEINRYGSYIAKGPFAPSAAATLEVLSDSPPSGTKITTTLRLDRVFSAVPDSIYFEIAAVSYPGTAQKYVKDLLYPSQPYVQKYSGSETSGSDDPDPAIDSSLDILSWKAIIQ